jgi:hypothetical protein
VLLLQPNPTKHQSETFHNHRRVTMFALLSVVDLASIWRQSVSATRAQID